MDIIPRAKVERFEQLKPGDLFLYLDGRDAFYALKTKQPQSGDRSTMVLLGPTFTQDIAESFLVPWQAVTALSFGTSYSILLPTDPKLWLPTGPTRTPVCLAIAGEKTYVCTNGGPSPQHYFPCFVDVETGAIIEGRLPSSAAFTTHWEIAVLGENHSPLSILKYPLQ